MDVFDLLAKLTLDTSEYESGLNNAKSSAEKGGSKIGAALGTAGKMAGAALAAAKKLINNGAKGNIVIIFPDRGDRYFTKNLYE